ncbi:hypothetical protein AB0I28_04460 [Phytomonospora sp. NPDC050363]|uniref:hypothetical protein n=1 Tax=Phytomonospora sp. NPDC050363 TaxID=3155642 RepID=UPI0034034716
MGPRYPVDPTPIATQGAPRPPRVWIAFLTTAAVLVTLLVTVAVWHPWAATATFTDGPASELGGAPAVRLAYTYLDATGLETNGSFTVTSDGYATGTVTDPGQGTATFMATPDGSAVYGDADWWLRRAPAQVAELRDRWVRPDAGVAFPFEPAAALKPSSIAALVSAVAAGGEAAEDDDAPVLTITSGAWTLLLSETTPRHVVSLSGPIESGRITPATGGAAPIVPLGLADGPGATYRDVDTDGSGHIVMSPEPEDKGPADTTRSDASATMSGRGPAPSAAPAPDSASGPPPAQADLPPQRPAFEVTYDLGSGPCITRTCSWSVVVANNGAVAGRVFVTLVERPGSTHGPFDLGVIEPGASAPSPTVSHPNQAIGTGGSVRISMEAELFSPDVDADQKKLNNVYKKGVPGANVWEVLARVGEHTADVLDIMNAMLDAGAQPAKVPEALDNAIDWGMLPHLVALQNAGSRAQVWQALAAKLSAGANEDQLRGYLRELHHAIDELNVAPDRTVTLDTPVREDGRLKVTDVVSAPGGSGGEKRCYQVKSVTNQAIIQHLDKAVDQLNGESVTGGSDPTHEEALNGCTALVRMFVEASSPYWNRDQEGLVDFLQKRRGDIRMCSTPDARFDGLVITTGKGTFTLTRDDICG